MSVWSQIVADAGGNRMAMQYADPTSGSTARFYCEARCSRADQRRKNRSLLELSQHLEEGVVPQHWMLSELDRGDGNGPKRLAYHDVKNILERKLAHNKRGLLTMSEMAQAVNDFKNIRSEEDFDAAVVEREIRRMNARLLRCNNSSVGSMSVKKEKG